MGSGRSPLWLLRNVSRGAARLIGKLDCQGPEPRWAAGAHRGAQIGLGWWFQVGCSSFERTPWAFQNPRSCTANIKMTDCPCCASLTAMTTVPCVWQLLGHTASSLLDSMPRERATVSGLFVDLPALGPSWTCWAAYITFIISFSQPAVLCSVYWNDLHVQWGNWTLERWHSFC